MTQSNSGEHFLHDRDPALHNSGEVEGVVDYLRDNGDHIPNEPAAKISAYVGFLANKDYGNDGFLTGDEDSVHRQIDALTIKPGNIPEAYFDLQRRIARDQGHGNIEITAEMRTALSATVREDQAKSLETWSSYLTDQTNDQTYPNWFKKYAMDGVKKLGAFDKEKLEFKKRSRGTTTPFPELNAEAVAYVYENIKDTVVKGRKADDETLNKLLRTGNFGKLYAHALGEAGTFDAERREVTEGSWRTFNRIQGDYKPDYDMHDGEATDVTPVDNATAMALSKSLRGYSTGWCTAGTRTAAHQLTQGDFYVYYSQDKDAEDAIPRIAIRMERGSVAEVRGIESNQNLEGNMTDIAMQKLNSLPGGDVYLKKAEDMRLLTEITDRYENGGELTANDFALLKFGDLQGFGYEKDPRIDEILNNYDSTELTKYIFESRDNRDLASWLIARGNPAAIINNIEHFDRSQISDSELLHVMIDAGSSGIDALAANAKFLKLTLSASDRFMLADTLINANSGYYVAGHPKFFADNEDGQRRIIDKLLQTKEDAADLAQNLSRYLSAVVTKDLVDSLRAKGLAREIAYVMDRLDTTIVDRNALWSDLVKGNVDDLGALVDVLDEFNPTTDMRSELVKQLVRSKDHYHTEVYLLKAKSMSIGSIDALALATNPRLIIRNSHKFLPTALNQIAPALASNLVAEIGSNSKVIPQRAQRRLGGEFGDTSTEQGRFENAINACLDEARTTGALYNAIVQELRSKGYDTVVANENKKQSRQLVNFGDSTSGQDEPAEWERELLDM